MARTATSPLSTQPLPGNDSAGTITTDVAAKLLMVTPEWVRRLTKDGWITKTERGRYRVVLPIRLLPTPPTCRMLPGSGVKLCVGRCGDVARDAEQGTEGVERIEPPVEAEGEFVEVGLQVLVTDPVMDAVQPRFQVCEDEMDDWQILLGDLRIAPFSDGAVFVAALGKAGVAAPVVGDERRARHNGALNEAAERLRAAVRHDGEPNPPGIATTLPLVELGARLALANLHSAGDKNLIVDATAFAARPAASPGFIDFDVLAGPAADPVLIRAHHPRAELVEDLERRLVARQAKLSPKLPGRHAGCLAGHQIGRPKPYAQRRVRARHDRSHRQSGVTAALAAAQDARTICEAERLSRRLTMGANKPVAPASLLQVGGAGRVVGKKSLELWERLWEPKIATLVNVHEHGRTLPLVAVGDNRIGKEIRTRKEELAVAQTERELVSLVEAMTLVDEVAGAVVARVNAIPTRFTRNIEQRAALQREMDEALAEVADRIEKLGATVQSGRNDPAADEEEAA